MSLSEEIYKIADELRGIANLGLQYSENAYDTERYEQVLSISARLIAALEQRPENEVLEIYKGDLSHVSPYAGADAAVFENGRILLIKREDNGLWAMPGGLVEVGETLADGAARELREEANVQGRATSLLGIFDSRLTGSRSRSQFYSALFLVEADDPQPQAGPETTDVGFFSEDSLPPLSPSHNIKVPLAFKLNRGEVPVPYFDAMGEAE